MPQLCVLFISLTVGTRGKSGKKLKINKQKPYHWPDSTGRCSSSLWCESCARGFWACRRVTRHSRSRGRNSRGSLGAQRACVSSGFPPGQTFCRTRSRGAAARPCGQSGRAGDKSVFRTRIQIGSESADSPHPQKKNFIILRLPDWDRVKEKPDSFKRQMKKAMA